MRDEISSHVSYGFTASDVSPVIEMLNDNSMSVTWRQISDGRLTAQFQLGPYKVLDTRSDVHWEAVVPSTAQLIQCTHVNVGSAVLANASYSPELPSACATRGVSPSKFVGQRLVPAEASVGGYFVLHLTFEWKEPSLFNRGVGRE
jgi:hypothetical protein